MPSNGYQWKLSDVLIILVLIFGVTNLFFWLFGEFVETLIPAQKFLFSSFLQTLIIFLAIIYFLAFRGGRLADVGIKRGINVFKIGIIGGILLFLAVIISGIIIELVLPFTPELQPIAQLIIEAEDYKDFIFLLFIGAFLAPVGEELYFRGVVYPAFKNKFGITSAMIISGCFFALLHFDIVRFIPLAIGGFGLAYIYERTGSIFAPIIAHSTWNAVMICLLYVTSRWI